MLIINGCVRLGTEGKFSECQYNMSFHVQKWPDISNDWSDIPSEEEANKKGGVKTMGGKIGRKKKEKKRKKKRKEKSTKQKERTGEGRGGRR